jgi:hypothetical protein
MMRARGTERRRLFEVWNSERAKRDKRDHVSLAIFSALSSL